MCMMPRGTPCECICAHCAHRWAACVSPSSRRTTVESNMKVIPGLWRHSTTCFFLLHFLLFSSCPLAGLGLFCTLTSLLSLSQRRQPLATFTRLCKTRVPCGRSAVLSSTSSIVLPQPSTSIISACDAWVPKHACECKLTFLSMTDAYIHTYIARIDPLLMRSAISKVYPAT